MSRETTITLPIIKTRKVGVANLFSINLLSNSKQEGQNFLSFYENNSGTLKQTLDLLLVDITEQRAWLTLWLKVDINRKNRMTFPEFCNLFKFDHTQEWSRRLFDIINTKLTGVVTFDEFITFCYKYLILDIEATKQFSFRLLSRRAATCDSRTVLDLQDMKFFLKFAYKVKKTQLDKVAMEIFNEMDDSGDFGINLTEFDTYSQRNPTFVAFGNYFLTHFRLCWFGYDYWLKRSQQVKKSRLVGFGSFIRLKSANLESEEYIKNLMKKYGLNPNNLHITKKTKNKDNPPLPLPPVTTIKEGEELSPPPITSQSDNNKNNNNNTKNNTKRRGSVFDRISQLTGKKKEEPKVGIGPGGVISEEFYDEDDIANIATVDGKPKLETDEEKAQRLNSLQFYERNFDYIKLTTYSFDKDFQDVILTRKTFQQNKVDQKYEQIASQLSKESQTYTLLTTVLDDLMNFRRGKRIAFIRWLKFVGMEGTREVIYRSESTIEKLNQERRKLKEDDSDDETGQGATTVTGTGTGTGTGDGDDGSITKQKKFIMTEEDEFKLHERIMQVTKQIQESGADEDAYSEFMREYNMNRYKKWFKENRTKDFADIRDQVILSFNQPNSAISTIDEHSVSL